MEVRLQADLERGPGLVPQAVLVGGSHVEAIGAWRQVCVRRLALVAGVDPLLVEAFEPVPEPHLARHTQAEAGEPEHQALGAGLERRPRRRNAHAVSDHILHRHRWRERIAMVGRGIDGHGAPHGREPQPPVTAAPARRAEAPGALAAAHAVGGVEGPHAHAGRTSGQERGEVALGDT
jgi:hypothetical protein